MGKPKLDKLVEKVCKSMKHVEMKFGDPTWREDIPRGPGWYVIRTNAPIKILQHVGKPYGVNHYNIPERIGFNLTLNKDLLISQNPEKDMYVVYNGETNALFARAREHFDGKNGTACLSLSQYEILHQYCWEYGYFPVSELGDQFRDHKSLRVLIEQGWRGKNGWPILCKN